MKAEKENIEAPALGCKVGQAYQVMLGQLDQALKAEGLAITTGEYLILRAIFSNEGLQQCEIADLVGKDKATVCRCVAALEKRGLAVTQSVSHKCLRVYPSDSAREIKGKIMHVARQRHNALLQLCTPEEVNILTSILNKIINSK